jgi:hypothetical protein
MMTEEETGTENNYIRHRQSWRSSKFNRLMENLDESRDTRTLARQREAEAPLICQAPSNAKKWMVHASDMEDSLPSELSDNQAD